MSRTEWIVEPPGRAAGRRILTSAEMRAEDRAMIETVGLPGLALMENAGRHVARAAAARCSFGRPIAVVCGRGNNGGDGLVAARHLADWGHQVDAIFCGDAAKATPDARTQLAVLRNLGCPAREIGDPEELAYLPRPGH